ncbi:tyrosine-type recombinase/integrase [Francisella uliginis]|uniref:Tyr recombinase domain-containing protein n=1 Tax=Francisella uliginis TaxID=573570 RepID=A0A1L4BPT5_9GAMM|nr:site-specific integrase [Francisella uliginis]API85855.1 hypothetical protein F7310_00125 [Francisella uliginis]
MAKLSKQFIEKSKEVKELKDKEKRYSDDNCTNLWFIARSSGVHSWLYRFKLNKKADSFTIGKYQDISLAEARELARNYNKILALGKNPKIERENSKLKDKDYFQNMAIEYLESRHPDKPNGYKSYDTYKRNNRILENTLLPAFKNYRLSDIKRTHVTNLLKEYTPHNGKNIKTLISQIFEHAIDEGLTENNPALKAKTKPIITQGFKFVDPIDDTKTFSQLMNDISNFNHGDISTIRALQLAPYVALRPSNIVGLKWSYLDENNKCIVIPGEEMKMKGRADFRQPLSKQAYDIIQSMKIHTANREFIFHSTRSKHKHVTIEALSKALRENLKFNGIDKPKQHTHGFRKTARTYISNIRSKHNWCDDAVRMILSHLKGDKIDNIYDKNDFLTERAEMLQLWADYIDHIKENANVIRMQDIS